MLYKVRQLINSFVNLSCILTWAVSLIGLLQEESDFHQLTGFVLVFGQGTKCCESNHCALSVTLERVLMALMRSETTHHSSSNKHVIFQKLPPLEKFFRVHDKNIWMTAFINRKIYIYNQYCYLRFAALPISWAQLKVRLLKKIQDLCTYPCELKHAQPGVSFLPYTGSQLQTEGVFFLLLCNYAVAFLGSVYNQFNAYILGYLWGNICCQDEGPPRTSPSPASELWAHLQSQPQAPQRKTSGQIVFDFSKEKHTQHYKLLKFTQCCTRRDG